ncbi:13734_t:CDS:2 [Ambispora leptoticha]|uniref:13734_t:CDS:1 n=1 Tax=Ambispora leptoticha TaxID=144679 RepID=A0A9N9G145_9GLOM|nr:13734_t:CDS:2 [Ambispora leptoticha]
MLGIHAHSYFGIEPPLTWEVQCFAMFDWKHVLGLREVDLETQILLEK